MAAHPQEWQAIARYDTRELAATSHEHLDVHGLACQVAYQGDEWVVLVAEADAQRARALLTDLARSLEAQAGGVLPVLDYSNPEEQRRVAVAHFPDSAEAHIAAGFLVGRGIDATVGEVLPKHGMGVRGGSLLVPAVDADRAAGHLATTPARTRIALAGYNAPQAVPSAACPKCGSARMRRSSLRLWIAVLGAITMIWMPLYLDPLAGSALYVITVGFWAAVWLSDRPWICESCSHRWSQHASE